MIHDGNVSVLPTVMQVPQALYTTDLGEAYAGDAASLCELLPDESIDLVVTSPPFALQRKKAYGNVDEEAYVRWFLPFTQQIRRILKPRGSFVLELGWAYKKGRPVRSLYNIEVLLRLCDEQEWLLAQEFYWYNPSKLPTPAEWVTVRRIRVKDAVSPIWWLAKTEDPKADWAGIDVSDDLGGQPQTDPFLDSGSLWYGDEAFSHGDLVAPNLLTLANTQSRSWYLSCCKDLGIKAHPARFPDKLPGFFIRGLTAPGDVVLDLFAGSNVTGAVAQKLGRRWVGFEKRQEYLAASVFRFLPEGDAAIAREIYERLSARSPGPVHLGVKLRGNHVEAGLLPFSPW